MAEPSPSDLGGRRLKLQFGHDCMNVGCNEPGCALCHNNPKRRCRTHFREKYVDNVNRVCTAWCDAPIQVRLVDAETEDEQLDTADLGAIALELVLLEGNAYEQRLQETGAGAALSYEECLPMMLRDNSTSTGVEPLLLPGRNFAPEEAGEHTGDNHLLVPFQPGGTRVLVRTSRSSQSAQGGRTRPFRLLARAVRAVAQPSRVESGQLQPVERIAIDVSEPFVVTTRRTQGAEKAVVPLASDSVSKLHGVGKETASKLRDLRAAGYSGPPLQLYQIRTVAELHSLVEGASQAVLRALGETLGLKLDKMAELQEGCRSMAVPDARKRVWGSPDFPSDRLVYPAEAGAVSLLAEHIDVMHDTPAGEVEVLSTAQLPPEDLARVIEMRKLAFASWWAPGHPGWGILDELQDPGAQGGGGGGGGAALQPTLSLAEQMVSESRQQRRRTAAPEAFPDPVEHDAAFGAAAPLLPADRYIGVEARAGPRAEPSYELDGASVGGFALPEHCMPGRSVFDDAAYPEPDPFEQAARDLEFHPHGADFAGALSGGLLEQPVGLAFITSGPNFERTGPIRFKRSVSGNRYKPTGADGVPTLAPAFPPPTGAAHQRALSDPFASADGAQQPHASTGVFSGLPPRASRELRPQRSFDRVANWQQSRSLNNSNRELGERYSHNLLGLLEEGAFDDVLEDVPPELEFR